MTVTTEEGGRTNMWATEPRMYMTKETLDRYGIETHNEFAEKLNGRAAMLGIVAGFISYAFTGHLFFGIIQYNQKIYLEVYMSNPNALYEDMERLNALYEELCWGHDDELVFTHENGRVIVYNKTLEEKQ